MATKFEVVLSASLDKSSISTIEKQIANIGKSAKINITADNSQVNNLTQSLKSYSSTAESATSQSQNLSDAITKFAEWQIIGDIIHGVKDAIVDMVDQVFELDESLTELDKVTDLTSAGLQALTEDAFEVGEQIGATGKSVIDATTIFAQAGYDAQEALDLSSQAITLMNVSEAGATASDSASTLISTLKGFSEQGLEAEHIVDALNEVSNKYAVSVSDLSTGVEKASAAMASSGNTFEEMMGLLTAGTEVMQNAGKVANALSTISARLTAENDEYIASITGGMGTIDDQTGELRSTYDILKDLAEVYPELTSVEKQEMVEVVAGKTQRTALTSILTNFESAIGATEAALNSEGSAVEENNKRMESLSGKLTQLESAWQSLANTTVNSDFIKNILTWTTDFVKFLDTIGGIQTLIPMVTAFIAVWQFNKIQSGLTSFTTTLKGIGEYIGTLSSLSKETGKSMISVFTQVTSAATLTKLAIGGIGLALTAGIAIWNAYQQAQEEARQTAIDNANAHLEEANASIESNQEQIESEQEAIEKLEEEKTALENLKSTDEGTQEKITEKQKEIDKRNENIAAMKEEARQESLKALGEVSSQEGGETAGGIYLYSGTGVGEEDEKLASYVKEFNELVKETDGNTGAYNRTIEELKTKYSNLLAEQKKLYEETGGLEGSYLATEKILELLNREQEKTAENYEEDAELAEIYYNALKNGVSELEAGQDMVDWMQDWYGLTEEQMEQLKEGTDVIAENAEATEESTEATEENAEALQDVDDVIDEYASKNEDLADIVKEARNNAEESQSTYDALSDTLDGVQSAYSALTSAVDEYNENGYLSIDTLQSLLALDDEYISMLSLENGQLTLNQQALSDYTNALIAVRVAELQNAAVSDIWALAEGNVENMSELAQAAVKQFGADGVAAGSDLASAVPDINSFTEAILQAKAAASEDGTDVENFEEKANAIISSYQNVYKNITALGSGTSSSAGKTYTGSSSSSSKSSGSGSSSSTSSSETYKAEVDALYSYKNALDNAEESVDKLNDALKNTENFDEQEKYLNQLIEATNNQITATNNLKNAQVSQINDYINQLRAQGFAIQYNSASNELYIQNMQHLADFTGDAAKQVEELIEEIQDLNDDNRDLDSSVRDLTADVKDYYDQLADIPEEKLEKFNELMEEFQQSQLDLIQDQIDDLEYAMEHDERLQALEAQLEALEAQKEALEEQETIEEKLLAVEEAKAKLNQVSNQRTLNVYTDEGWVKENAQ